MFYFKSSAFLIVLYFSILCAVYVLTVNCPEMELATIKFRRD